MYPNLSYFFHDIFGTDVDNWTSLFQSFGLFFALGLLTAAYLLKIELKRMAKKGIFTYKEETFTTGKPLETKDYISSAIFGFIIGFKGVYALLNKEVFFSDPPHVLLSTKGVFWAGLLGMAIFVLWRYFEGKKQTLPKPLTTLKKIFPHDRIGEITTVAAVSGLIGSKLFTVVEDWDGFLANPAIFFSGSGLTIYGGLIFGFIGVYWYIKKFDIPPLNFMDAIAPGMIAGYAVGRIGCQVSGDGDWGIANTNPTPDWWFLPDWMWAYDFPHNVSNQGELMADCVGKYCYKLVPAVYPTSFYEVIMGGLIFLFLWSIRKKINIPGFLFFLYVLLNGLERFNIEKIRVNIKYNYFGLHYSQAQFIAVILMIIGVVGMFLLYSKHKKRTT